MPRTASIDRKTHETHVRVTLDLDGGAYQHKTGVGFFDHMLDHVARHGRLGLSITAQGDHHIDDHHTVEDVGIALGQALHQALGDKRGIERFGFASVAMDEALARVTLDLSGRSSYDDGGAFGALSKIGGFDVQLVPEFLKALSDNGRFNLHVEVVRGDNEHHRVEAVFKALGRALREAVRITGSDVPSTKGVL